jgi:hypothetical protein
LGRKLATTSYKNTEQEEFDLTQVIELARNLYAVNQTVADLYNKAMAEKLPCGYVWTTIKLTDHGWILEDVTSAGEMGTKEGQALTGDVKHRVQDYNHTTHPQLILDVLIDPFFSKPQQDKVLMQWRDDKEDGVEIDHTKRTIEGMIYEDLEAFQNLRINRRVALKKLTGNPMAGAVEVFLGTTQWWKAAAAIRIFKEGGRSILADLCARFGKTIWSGVVADMTGSQVVVVASYVKTVHTSFRQDFGDKKQFLEVFAHVNTEDKDWKEQIDAAIKSGKRVICYLSLCQGNYRQDRINYIGSLLLSRMWIIDEADFGAHQKKQVDALKQGVKDEDLLLLMTGTNPDVAVRQWASSRNFKDLVCTYSELLIQKNKTKLEMYNA